jgi:hypothetical protein
MSQQRPISTGAFAISLYGVIAKEKMVYVFKNSIIHENTKKNHKLRIFICDRDFPSQIKKILG